MRAGIVLTLSALMALSCSDATRNDSVALFTGNEHGTFYKIGKNLAWYLNNDAANGVSASVYPSDGSAANLAELRSPGQRIAIVGKRTLLANPESSEAIAVLAPLHTSVLHIIAPAGRAYSTPPRLSDLKGRDELVVFAGPEKSGLRPIAEAILGQAAVGEYSFLPAADYAAAASQLGSKFDVVFFLAGVPSSAAKRAVSDGGVLLSIDSMPASYEAHVIPAYEYLGQTHPVTTVANRAYLVARRDLEPEVGLAILDALYNNARRLVRVHPIGHEIARISGPLKPSDLPNGFEPHRATEEFASRDSARLRIVTGAADEPYYQAGRELQRLLSLRKVDSYVTATSGSRANLKHLNEQRPTIAIVQYDVLLASILHDPTAVFRSDPPVITTRQGTSLEVPNPNDPWRVPRVDAVHRIASLHNEYLFAFSRTDTRCGGEACTLGQHEGARVSFGPRGSGTQLLARAVFGESRGRLARAEYLKVRSMVSQLHDDHLTMGFAIAAPFSPVVQSLLANDRIRLLSLPPRTIERLRDPGYERAIIPSTYGTFERREGREAGETVTTLMTFAVLVVNRHVADSDVRAVADAVLSQRDIFVPQHTDDEQRIATIVQRGDSVPLHPVAAALYRERGKLPPLPTPRWRQHLDTSAAVAGFALALATLGSLVAAIRNRLSADELERRIVSVNLGAAEEKSVRQLVTLQEEGKHRLSRSWWQPHAISVARWREIDDLVERRMDSARERLTRTIARRIADHHDGSESSRASSAADIRRDTLGFFEAGELASGQFTFLRDLLEERERGAWGASAGERH